MVSGVQTIEKFNGIAYEPVHRHAPNVTEQRMHRDSDTNYKQDDDPSVVNHLITRTFENDVTTAAAAAVNAIAAAAKATETISPTHGDDFVDNVSSSGSIDAKSSCLRRRNIKSASRKSSPKAHCNNNEQPSSTASTCDLMQPAARLRQTSAGHDCDMSAVHRPQFASGAKLKKIVFNGTFPIDDPYSSRFDNDGHLLQ